jgi:hypothetical protein
MQKNLFKLFGRGGREVCERKIICTFFGCYLSRVFLGVQGVWSLSSVELYVACDDD